MLLKLHQLTGGSVTDFEVSDSVYGVKDINKYIISQVVRWQLHKRKEILSRSKTRSEVKGSGRKIYRQKGTGNARHSDKYAPQFRKGGVAHGAKGTKSKMSVPKKVKRLALRHTLSSVANEGRIFIYNDLTFDAPKTKEAIKIFSELAGKKVLFIDVVVEKSSFMKSIDNIVGFNYLPVVGLNVYDLIRNDIIVIAKQALQMIEERVL